MSDNSTTINIPEFEVDRLADAPRVSLVIYHRDGAKIVTLPEGRLVVGRSEPADVAVADPSLSRQHAAFEREGDAITIEDLGSTNGTRVNGKRIKRARVRPGDEITIGAVIAAIHVVGPAEPLPGGLEGHDDFLAALEQEVVRARTFKRQVALVMVRAAKRGASHLDRWCPRVRGLLRPVDVMALYGPDSVSILMPETDSLGAQTLADRIVRGQGKGEPTLLCGLGSFPASATSADELVGVVRRASQAARPKEPIVAAAAEGDSSDVKEQIVAVSPQMQQVLHTAARVAEAQIPVLMVGETGTGKEVVARAIHDRSRRSGPLRCINCGAIPGELIESLLFGHQRGAFTGAERQTKGIFEQADGGTVLLDEIGELSAAAQAALLRVLETKRITRVGDEREIEIDVRVLAATHRDLEQMCASGTFRQDLLYRLNTMTIELPPLRARREDLLPLAEYFVKVANKANGCRVKKIDPQAQKLLVGYRWPGNVRELRNVIERAVVIAQDDVITTADLSERVRGKSAASAGVEPPPIDDDDMDVKAKLQRYEAQLLVDALEKHDWNQTATAKALGMPLRTLVHKVKRYGIRKKYEV